MTIEDKNALLYSGMKWAILKEVLTIEEFREVLLSDLIRFGHEIWRAFKETGELRDTGGLVKARRHTTARVYEALPASISASRDHLKHCATSR